MKKTIKIPIKINLLLFAIIFLFSACSNNNIKWKKIGDELVTLNLQSGDIIIKEKELTPLGLFGHSAIMKTANIVLDYPKLGEKSYEIDIRHWLEKNRDILVLRYKNFNPFFKEKLLENMDKYSSKNYKIIFDKTNNENFYCSQFIWYIYYKTAQEFGFELDLDSDSGFFVFPYDFINSKELFIVD